MNELHHALLAALIILLGMSLLGFGLEWSRL